LPSPKPAPLALADPTLQLIMALLQQQQQQHPARQPPPPPPPPARNDWSETLKLLLSTPPYK
jgi:hypothetical protein